MTPPKKIGPYRILRKLGQGGMGVVYEVQDPLVDRTLALKLILEDGADSVARERFAREASVLAQLQHRNVVKIHKIARSRQGPYMLQELIQGDDLKAVRARRALAPEEIARIVRQLTDAVAAVHQLGILHRDIKPGNVILRPNDEPVLLDFGLSRDESAERLTKTGVPLGTPTYMSPEQADGRRSSELTAATDVYSLGALLYFLLVGRSPFEGTTMAVIKQVLEEDPVWPTAAGAEVPWALEAICRAAMAKDPLQRYPTPEALRAELDRFLAGQPVKACERFRQPGGRRLPLLLGVAVLLPALAAGVWAIRGGGPADPPPGSTPVETRSTIPPAPTLATSPEALPEFLSWNVEWSAKLQGSGKARWLSPERVLVAVESEVKFWKVGAVRPQVTLALPGKVKTLALHPSREWAVLACEGLLIRLELGDEPSLQELQPPPSGFEWISALAFDPSGEQLALGGKGADGALLALLESGPELRELARVQHPGQNPVGVIAFSADGAHLAAATDTTTALVAGTLRNTWCLYRAAGLEPLEGRSGEVTLGAISLAFIPEQDAFVLGGRDFTIRRLPLEDAGEPTFLLGPGAEGVAAIRLGGVTDFAHNGVVVKLWATDDGRLISASSNSLEANVPFAEFRVWRRDGWTQIQEHRRPYPVHTFDLDAERGRLLIGYNGRVEVMNLREGR